jgi:polysaccharide chain length determinant protein (PEP-CTERM system associated)
MPIRTNLDINDYLGIITRKGWFILILFLFILFAASVYCVVVPMQFQSTTTILVIPQRVPENYVRSTVSNRIEDRLATIQQQVMSRTRLTTVMDELGLFREERRARPIEEVLEMMRKRIELKVRGTDAFSISFVHENRQLTMLTTSRLASFFIDENLKTREQQAVGTSEFLESQLAETKAKLEGQEEKVKEYKMKYIGELPQETEANLRMLSRLQDQAKTNSDAYRSAEDRKFLLESQLSSLENLIVSLERPFSVGVRDAGRESGGGVEPRVDHASVAGGQDPLQVMQAELVARRTRLDELTSRFTDRYPEVVKTRREVEALEKRINDYRKATSQPASNSPAERGTSGGETRSPSTLPPPTGFVSVREREEAQRMRLQLSTLNLELAALKREKEEVRKSLDAFQARVERAPRREQEMIALTRDYENIRRSYDDLLRKKLDAEISQNLEKRQKGEQFQILDPAPMPQKPFKPDKAKVYALAFIGGLILSFGGAFGIEMSDSTLKNSREFKQFFQIPVLASLPLVSEKGNERKAAIRVWILSAIAVMLAGTTIVFVLYGERLRSLI